MTSLALEFVWDFTFLGSPSSRALRYHSDKRIRLGNLQILISKDLIKTTCHVCSLHIALDYVHLNGGEPGVKHIG